MSQHRFCVAPMMEWTDRHDRYFLRLLSRRAFLYTEMVTTGALIHGDRRRHLTHHPIERPVGLQLGGSDPAEMALCARMAEDAGFDEVNINAGCPSDRVQSGRFGACLMAEPDLLAECVASMRASVRIPVTVKNRIGIDDRDTYEELHQFVETLAAGGCRTFMVHARKAWLKGLSPKQNRELPPLRYGDVYRLKEDFPALEVVLNGGIGDIAQAEQHLAHVDGVMLGRSAYQNPYLLAEVDRRLFGEPGPIPTRREVVERFLPYVAEELSRGVYLGRMTRHILGLYHGAPGARAWRRELSERSHRTGAGIEVIRDALGRVEEWGIEGHGNPAPRGTGPKDPGQHLNTGGALQREQAISRKRRSP